MQVREEGDVSRLYPPGGGLVVTGDPDDIAELAAAVPAARIRGVRPSRWKPPPLGWAASELAFGSAPHRSQPLPRANPAPDQHVRGPVAVATGPGCAPAACKRWSAPNSRRSGAEPCSERRSSRRSRTARRSSLAQDGTFGIRRRRWSLSAGALAVPAPWPAAGPTLAFLQLLLGPANAAFSGHLLLGILDPADELVSGQRRDVLPSIERRRVGDQRVAQVCGKVVHHPTGHSLVAHGATVAVQVRIQGRACFTNSAAPILGGVRP